MYHLYFLRHGIQKRLPVPSVTTDLPRIINFTAEYSSRCRRRWIL